MLKRLAWVVLIAAAAAGGCMSASGAVRGDTAIEPGARPASTAPAGDGMTHDGFAGDGPRLHRLPMTVRMDRDRFRPGA